MDTNDRTIHNRIKTLLEGQRLAVLATQNGGQPYTSLMAFAFTEDLTEILVATEKSSRKHRNITEEPRVSLLIDNRSNNEEDFDKAVALTVLGKAVKVEPSQRQAYKQIYLKRHPGLHFFVTSPSTAFLKIEVYRYLLVSKFQAVTEYRIHEK